MLNTVYQLAAPRRFEIAIRDDLFDPAKHLVVRPTHLSICNADQRYYQGLRNAEVMAKKLPMALIHEAIGKIIYAPCGTFPVDSPVVMIPNLPTERHPVIAENYLRSSKFRGSSTDGFMQEVIITEPDRVLQLPDSIDRSVAAITELVSVVMHAIDRFQHCAHNERSSIGVWGDGNVGFITALLLKRMQTASKVFVFGRNVDKLADFSFVDGTFLVSDLPNDLTISHAFECVGGQGSVSAIEQIIDHIQPEGSISLLGVSENPVPINTRMVLEKGLRLIGNSRSGRADFEAVLNFYVKDPLIIEYLKRIIGEVIEVSSISDVSRAFEADIARHYGKTIMQWSV